MVRNHGIPKAFEVDASFNADRKIGQLVRIKNNAGSPATITNVMGEGDLAYFPLIEDVVVSGNLKTKDAGVTVSGVAKVYVEAAAGIGAGEEVGVGATGIGVAIYSTGFKLGIALSAPAGDGDYIEVLLAPTNNGATY